MKIDTLYRSYEDLLIDINIYGRIMSFSSVSKEDLETSLTDYYSSSFKEPTLEDKRYILSPLVSEDYSISNIKPNKIDKEQYTASVDVFNNSIYIFSIADELSTVSTYTFSLVNELRTNSDKYVFSVSKESINSRYIFRISDECKIVYKFSIRSELDENHGVFSITYRFNISDELSSVYVFSILTETSTVYTFSISAESVTVYKFSVLSESLTLSDSEDTNIANSKVAKSSNNADIVLQEVNLHFTEDTEVHNQVTEPSLTTNNTMDVESKKGLSRDTFSVTEDNDNTDIEIPKDLVEFLKRYPKSEMSFVLRYFTNAEITKAIKLNRVFKKKNKLFI